jgi:hypothetical protein
MEQLIDMVVVSFERTKTHAMPQCVESGSAYGFMQRVSVAMACVVPLLSRFTCARLRQVLSVSTLCLFSVSVGVQLVCNFSVTLCRLSVCSACPWPWLASGSAYQRVSVWLYIMMVPSMACIAPCLSSI